MREFSLFSGAGGGLLATRHLLGWTTVGYVEFNDYCQRVLRARIDDGLLDDAPIFGDIRSFIGDGYAASYTGLVDVVTAGFPCPAFSTAGRGRQRVEADLWPECLEAIEIVRPRSVLLENVDSKPIERAEEHLHAAGYLSKPPLCLEAADIGAVHRRPRWWLFANADGQSEPRRTEHAEVAGLSCIPGLDWWENPPEHLGVDDGVAHRMDRLGALGNGQIPAVAALAWQALIGNAR